jgi:hypothetical protein
MALRALERGARRELLGIPRHLPAVDATSET